VPLAPNQRKVLFGPNIKSSLHRTSHETTVTQNVLRSLWRGNTRVLSTASKPCTEPHDLDDLDAPGRVYTGRATVRALWTVGAVEVRVLTGALVEY